MRRLPTKSQQLAENMLRNWPNFVPTTTTTTTTKTNRQPVTTHKLASELGKLGQVGAHEHASRKSDKKRDGKV